jgi:hypothetical protein
MLDLLLRALSALLNVNLKDPHDIPFALPLLMFPFLGFVISMIVLRFIGNNVEQEEQP